MMPRVHHRRYRLIQVVRVSLILRLSVSVTVRETARETGVHRVSLPGRRGRQLP